MRIGRVLISREHPSERALRRYGQLSPELRELIARVVRSTAKDHVQDVMEAQGLAYNADGSPMTAQQRQMLGLPAPDDPNYISRTLALRALSDVHHGVETCRADNSTAEEVARADDLITQAYELVRGHK